MAPMAEANLIRGIVRMAAGILTVPGKTLAGTFSGPPIIGTVAGLLNGTLTGLGMVAQGALETASGAVGLALKAAPFIPIFL
jgi:hypothetical protein